LAPPLKLKVLTEGRSKIDWNDAEMLAELLRIDVDSSSYVPPKDIRTLRDLHQVLDNYFMPEMYSLKCEFTSQRMSRLIVELGLK
jgi:hypothetical protein